MINTAHSCDKYLINFNWELTLLRHGLIRDGDTLTILSVMLKNTDCEWIQGYVEKLHMASQQHVANARNQGS